MLLSRYAKKPAPATSDKTLPPVKLRSRNNAGSTTGTACRRRRRTRVAAIGPTEGSSGNHAAPGTTSDATTAHPARGGRGLSRPGRQDRGAAPRPPPPAHPATPPSRGGGGG